MQVLRIVLAGCIFLVGIASASASETYDDSAALKGLTAAKGIFLLDFKTAKTTAFYLDLVVGTYDGLIRQKVEPEMVVVVLGPTVKFLSKTNDPELAFDYEDEFNSIQHSLSQLEERGVRVEVCAIALDLFKVDHTSLPMSLKIVADGFISLIGWQNQSFKLIPVFS